MATITLKYDARNAVIKSINEYNVINWSVMSY